MGWETVDNDVQSRCILSLEDITQQGPSQRTATRIRSRPWPTAGPHRWPLRDRTARGRVRPYRRTFHDRIAVTLVVDAQIYQGNEWPGRFAWSSEDFEPVRPTESGARSRLRNLEHGMEFPPDILGARGANALGDHCIDHLGPEHFHQDINRHQIRQPTIRDRLHATLTARSPCSSRRGCHQTWRLRKE